MKTGIIVLNSQLLCTPPAGMIDLPGVGVCRVPGVALDSLRAWRNGLQNRYHSSGAVTILSSCENLLICL